MRKLNSNYLNKNKKIVCYLTANFLVFNNTSLFNFKRFLK